MDGLTITGVTTSVRSRLKSNELEYLLNSFSCFDDVLQYIYKFGGDQKISNSEALAISAMYGSKMAGLQTKFLCLNDHFSMMNSEPKDPETLRAAFRQTNGFLLSSPVYFGDRSSMFADLIEFFRKNTAEKKFAMDGKAVGTVAVGAKRNGGQETTNVYGLYDCVNLGACIVGNGPPTSQYGGTGWAGKVGAIIDDNFGIETAKGTGCRVGMLSKVLSLPDKYIPVRILFVVSRADKHGYFIRKIKELSFPEGVKVDVINLAETSIKRCIACPICPNGNFDMEYTCVIPSESPRGEIDDMQFIHKHLIKADCIVLAHYSGADAGPDNFQVFVERTRFIRRNNFELGDKGFSVFTETDSLYSIYPLRFMTSFLRHNLFIVGPFYTAFQTHKDGIVHENIPTQSFAERVSSFARKSRQARESGLNTFDSTYVPIGYPDIMKA